MKQSTFRNNLKEIVTYHSDDGTSGYLLNDDQIDSILQLIKEIVPEKTYHFILDGKNQKFIKLEELLKNMEV
jgi:hypothetical protein